MNCERHVKRSSLIYIYSGTESLVKKKKRLLFDVSVLMTSLENLTTIESLPRGTDLSLVMLFDR